MFVQVLNLVAGTMGIAASIGLVRWLIWYAYQDDNSPVVKGDDNNEND